jgi:hypothetical protein
LSTTKDEPDTIFESQQLTELSDDQDAFGHQDYAAAIAEVLVEARTPFTLGLYGPWGVGKTLILREARKRVGQRCAFVIFDAWRYDGDALRRHFLRDIARQLKDEGELEDWYKPEEQLRKLDVSRSVPTSGQIRLAPDQLYIGLAGLAIIGLLALFLAIAGDFHRALTGLVAGAGVVALAIAALTPFTRVLELTQVTEVSDRLVDPELFTREFEDLLAAIKQSRLVVAIDNLDRCSPRRVTELLETLNTYLEPASQAGSEQSERLRERRGGSQKPDAVFAVAADDIALKRHIESLEAKASAGAEDSFGEDSVREDVGRYADEYLRKIFTATVPIKPALASDLRVYVARRLKKLVDKRGIEPEDRDRLVEVITEGLRRNPRRVTQFIRNLELRLLVLDERHEATPPRMAERLTTSEHIPFVAKLLVLEEEWPTAFRELERDPSRLTTWHEQQQAATDSEEFAGKPLAGETADSRVAFVGFLATTRTISSTRLPAFLSLKQSKIEVELPRYADFTAALTSGQPALLKEVTESAGNQLQDYANQLRPLAQAQLPRYRATARVVVETALADPVLAEKAQPTLASLLQWAVERDDQFRAELSQANPEVVLRASAWLSSKSDFNRVVGLFLGSEVELPVPWIVGLPADRISDENRQVIREAINGEVISSNPSTILSLLRWNQWVATAEAATAALSRLTSEPNSDGPDAEIVEISLRSVWREQGASNQVLSAVATILAAAYAPAPLDERVAIVGRLVALMRQIAENDEANPIEPSQPRVAALAAIAQQINGAVLPNITDATEVAPWLDLTGELARLSGAPDHIPTLSIIETLRTRLPDALIAYAKERGKDLCPSLLPGLTEELGVIVDGPSEDAAEALAAVDPTDSQGQLAAAANRAVASQRYPFVDALLDKYPTLSVSLPGLAGAALAGGANDPAGLNFALAQAPALTPEELDSLENSLVEMIAANADGQSYDNLLRTIEGSPAFDATRYERIVWSLWDRAKASPAPPLGLLQLVLPRFDKLDPARQNTLPEVVKTWLVAVPPGQLLQVLRASSYKGKARAELVAGLIEREPLVAATEYQMRADLLGCALTIAQGSAKATQSVEDRIGSLREGTNDDQEVYKLLNPEGGTESD